VGFRLFHCGCIIKGGGMDDVMHDAQTGALAMSMPESHVFSRR
jgi:hypothetical protein